MKLRKLILAGFKSFAERTEFEFDDGISCIVGPNGCGKSNVVDAIKWVLGEQSAKSLRGSEMLDVIFNGSSNRRPGGHAEVTLVFDNPSGLLKPNIPTATARSDADATSPPSNDQVSITRRLFRSGQSEYLINKTVVRLRDIREMFMDTGVGVRAYGVIEQGHVEVFLQASHEERRAIFDEAAGISKYKARRKEATRKLERVEQNMLRLADVLGEVERRLRSIKYQAGKARNYQVYTQQLNELKSLHFLSQFHQLSQRRGSIERELDDSNDKLAMVNTRIGQLDAAFAATRAEVEDMERSVRDLRVRIATIAGQITTCQERADAQTDRIKELGEQAVAFAARSESLEAKIASLEEDLIRRVSEQGRLGELADELAGKYETFHRQYQEGEVEIAHLRRQVEDEKNGTMELIRRTAQHHNEVQASGVRRDNLSGQYERLSGRAGLIAKETQELLVQRSAVEARVKEVQDTLSATKERLERTNQDLHSSGDDEHDLQDKLAFVRERRSALNSRADALGEMQQRLAGVGEGVRRVLHARGEGRLPCISGMLGDFLSAEVKHAPLIEVALGGADQQLIAVSFSDLSAAIDDVTEALGKNAAAEVWCLDRLGPWKDDFDAGACDAVIARAIDWVSFDPMVAPAVWQALGRTLVVQSLSDARAVAKIAPQGYRFVTVTGEVVEADGRVRLGWANRAAGVITRRGELAQLKQQLQKLDQRIVELRRQRQIVKDRREHLEGVLQALRTAVYENSMELTSAEGRLKRIDEQVSELKREEPIVDADLRRLVEEMESAVRIQHEAKEKADQLDRICVERQEHIKALEIRIADMRSDQAKRAQSVTEVKVALGQAEEKTLALDESISSVTLQRDQARRDFEAIRAQIEQCHRRRGEAEAAVKAARSEIESLYAQHESLNRDGDDIEETRRGLTEKIEDIRRDLTVQQKVRQQADEKVSACRIEVGQLEANIANLVARSADDMNMNLPERHRGYTHDENRDWSEVARQIKQLEEKIRRLGNVNLDAITEQDELEARQALYAGQIKDVDESRGQLSELIRRINKESRRRFEETFVAVRENFQGLFRKLFGGGRADILLTDPGDMLESGIEIIARPPGKELRSISLLSGGEKTMAALALLFSIFKCKPSPFCLLDEVDAALDEANTERFTRMIGEFVPASQFVIISHSKRTMSLANVLYGVTMQEPGISKRISVRFEDADKCLERDLEPVGAV